MSLNTPFNKPVLPDSGDLGGALPTTRGTDPLIDTGGSSGLQAPFAADGAVLGDASSLDETANPVSGLPLQPNRFQPSETPPAPPTLTTRNPGTVDQQ